MRPHACPRSSPSVGIVSHHSFNWEIRIRGSGSTHQSLHGTVLSVLVVAAELGVDTLERGVTVGLGLLDTVRWRATSVLLFRVSLDAFPPKAYIICRSWIEVILKIRSPITLT